MQIQNIEQSHNEVSWEINTKLLPRLLALSAAAVTGVTLLALLPNPNALRWILVALLLLSTLAVAFYLALTTPLSEQVLIQRTPEGGNLQREQSFLWQKDRLMAIPLAEVLSFGVERRDFEQTGERLITLARLVVHCARGEESEVHYLSDWLTPESVQELAVSSSKATRRPLNE